MNVKLQENLLWLEFKCLNKWRYAYRVFTFFHRVWILVCDPCSLGTIMFPRAAFVAQFWFSNHIMRNRKKCAFHRHIFGVKGTLVLRMRHDCSGYICGICNSSFMLSEYILERQTIQIKKKQFWNWLHVWKKNHYYEYFVVAVAGAGQILGVFMLVLHKVSHLEEILLSARF